MSSMRDMFITDQASLGVKLPLLQGGEKSDLFIMVRGKDSPEYRQATAESVIRSRDVMLSESPLSDRAASLVKERYKVLASLVADWSFDEEVTPEAAFEFVSSVEDEVCQSIDRLANTRDEYLKKP